VVPEVIAELSYLTAEAIREGIESDRIIIDPGIGFGKRLSDNLALLRHLPAFVSLGRPVAVGVSRKSFLGKLVRDEGPATSERSDATLAAESLVVAGGAQILRTHDPARAARAARIGAAFAGRFMMMEDTATSD
jgi:dihydropteroate synthase